MLKFKVRIKTTKNGEVKYIDDTYLVQGKDLDEETIVRRLTNNMKTWQTACNRGFFRENWTKFELVSYEEVK